MKALLLALASLSSIAMAAPKTLTQEVSTSTWNFKIDQAVIVDVATQTAIRDIPGCRISEAVSTCQEEVVLATQKVVDVYVNYQDTYADGDSWNQHYLTFRFPLSAFSAADVATLSAVSPMWKWDTGNVRRNFAASKFALNVANVAKSVQVVDMARSKVCVERGEAGVDPNCQEHLVYKMVPTTVSKVSLTLK